MAFKVVVSQKAETYQVEVDEANSLNGLVIGDEFETLYEFVEIKRKQVPDWGKFGLFE